jgi:hypothetical protein
METPADYYDPPVPVPHVLAQKNEPLGDPPKNPNLKPYLTHSADPNLPPLGSKFRSYNGQHYNATDTVYPSLSQQREFPDLDKKRKYSTIS